VADAVQVAGRLHPGNNGPAPFWFVPCGIVPATSSGDSFLPAGADATTFILRLGEVKKLVLQARLDLAETKAERIKAIEETIKEIEPFVDAYEKRAKAGIGSGVADVPLAQVYLLELKIALEKTKQE